MGWGWVIALPQAHPIPTLALPLKGRGLLLFLMQIGIMHQLRLERVEQSLSAVYAQFVIQRTNIIRDGVIADIQLFGDLPLGLPLCKQ